VPEGARDPARLQAGRLSRREPGEFAGLAITGAGEPVVIRASQAVVMQAGAVAAGGIPAVVVAGLAGRQHPACPAGGRAGTDGTSSSSCPAADGSLAAYAAIPAWVTLRPGGGGGPGPERAGRITCPGWYPGRPDHGGLRYGAR